MSVPAVETSETIGQRRPNSRIDALDWTKGALVLCMVVYHAINYSAFRPMAFRFLGFLPPSFIFIAGFLVGQVYAMKYDLDTWNPYLRLMTRGFKLLLLFLVLNVATCVLLQRGFADGMWKFADRAGAMFLSGNGRNGVFEVLLPIAYFLMLAPALLWIRSRASAAIALSAGAVFFLCVALDWNGTESKNLSLLSAGVLGMAAGLISFDSVNRFARRWPAILGLYALYRLCSYIWGEWYPVQMFGAVISLAVLYGCALHLDCASAFGRQMVLLGKYSLLGYLVQIPLIRIIVGLFGGRPNHWIGVSAVTVTALVLLFLVIRGVHGLRRRNRFAHGVYAAVLA